MAAPSDSERLAKIERDLARLIHAMLGDDGMGVRGMVANFEAMRADVSGHAAAIANLAEEVDFVRREQRDLAEMKSRLAEIEMERGLEAEDRQWVKEMRTNWASPFRLILAALGIAITAALGAFIARQVG